ncbi:MAG: hypothetical protein KIT84_35825 [Labilithrix sp.]|nr:hypothetical protein [Labilithrix sp.]MCW5816423.1 hypothetical protein [Labilithrix sp.]
MSPFDRLARRLAPWTGLLTVAGACQDIDCEETGDTVEARLHADAVVTADLGTSSDGVISAPRWQCTGALSSSTRRPRASAASINLTSQIHVTCVLEGSSLVRTYRFDAPLRDPRDLPSEPEERDVSMSVHIQTTGAPGNPITPVGCNGAVPTHLRVTPLRAAGTSAPPPAHVTPDFVRELELELATDATSEATTGSTCRIDLRGTLKLDVTVTPSSFSEQTATTCL